MGTKVLMRVGGAALAATLAGALAMGPADARDRHGKGIGWPVKVRMSGANEVNAAGAPSNPHGNADRGRIKLWLDQKHDRVCWKVISLTLTAGEALPSAAHIHEAPMTAAGPVRVDLFGTASSPPAPAAYPTSKTCVSAARAQIVAIRQNPGSYYVNLHNAQHPSGVMRGQLH